MTTQALALIDPTLDQPKLNQAMAQMRADGVGDQQARDERVARFSEQVGIAKFAGFQQHITAAAEIKVYLEIKESNDFKDLPIARADGSLRPAETIKELCQLVFGKSYTVMEERAQNMNLLGEAAFDASRRLALSRHQLRLIRSLPETQQSAVKAALEAESKDEVVALIEDLASQLAQANEAVEEAKAEAEANEKLLAKKDEKINKLSRHIAKLTPDDKLAELEKECTQIMTDAVNCLRGQMYAGLMALKEHDESDRTLFMAGLVGQVQFEVAALREAFSLPDVGKAADLERVAEMEQWLPKKAKG